MLSSCSAPKAPATPIQTAGRRGGARTVASGHELSYDRRRIGVFFQFDR